MPASRITVNTPTTHGAIGFSTALPPSMTLGCGSWGGNVTSDNVSPLHLMDIKRVAFETRPVKSARPAVSAQPSTPVSAPAFAQTARQPAVAGGKINRDEIAAIVDKFLAGKRVDEAPTRSPLPKPLVEVEAGSMYTPSPEPPRAGNGAQRSAEPVKPVRETSENGRQAVEFVSEDDVRRAVQKGEKIYINARTIITPAARDIGEPSEVFAKV